MCSLILGPSFFLRSCLTTAARAGVGKFWKHCASDANKLRYEVYDNPSFRYPYKLNVKQNVKKLWQYSCKYSYIQCRNYNSYAILEAEIHRNKKFKHLQVWSFRRRILETKYELSVLRLDRAYKVLTTSGNHDTENSLHPTSGDFYVRSKITPVLCRYLIWIQRSFYGIDPEMRTGGLEFIQPQIQTVLNTKTVIIRKYRTNGRRGMKDFTEVISNTSTANYAINEKKEKLKEKRAHIQERKQILLRDIRETKEKLKDKMEMMLEKDNIWTIPNTLCMTRIVLTPWLSYLVIHSHFSLALGVFVVAGITDLLDGWIARNFKNQSSMMGSFLDPLADKVLVGVLFLSLTYMGLIPVPLTALIILRDVTLLIAAFYIRYLSLPHPRTVMRYFDVTHATAQLAPTYISKVNTGMQLLLVAVMLGAPVFSFTDHLLIHVLWYTTAGTTVMSGLSYVFSKNTYKFLKKTDISGNESKGLKEGSKLK